MRSRASLLLLLLATACASPPPPAAPAPAAPPPPAPPPAPIDWRSLPLTAGSWRYQPDAATPAALFDDGHVVLRCDKALRQITLSGTGLALPVTVTTSSGARVVTGAIPAADRLLDEIALSRGRFMLDNADGTRLVLPAWAEVARVVEDCRL